MFKLPKWIKRYFCRHEYKFVRNIYGDEIIEYGYKRSIHKCVKCGAVHCGELLKMER